MEDEKIGTAVVVYTMDMETGAMKKIGVATDVQMKIIKKALKPAK